MKRTSLVISVLFLFINSYSQQAAPSLAKQIQDFDTYVEQSRNSWQVPGLSIAVVKDGKVIFKKGYVVRELGKPDKVDTQTLFACASTTKAMTAMCMGMLVDEGKVNWDDAVIKYLPDFKLYDPYVTRELKIRDLFTHNSGVGNADFLWDIMDIPSDEVLKKMADVKPSYSLRSSFIYQNIFYLAAGKIIEKVSGLPWEKFVAARIFEPLGMTRTVPMRKDVKDPNQTSAHFFVHNAVTVIELSSADAIAPAGSVWSCADDMSKWMLSMLDSSKYEGGKRLVTAKTWMEMLKPQVMVTAGEFYPTAQLTKPNWTTYGLGWFQQDYRGHKINFHTGSLFGAIAINGQLPDEKLGVYVFGNYDHAEVRHALMFKAFDHFALGGTRDWNSEFLKLYGGLRAQGVKAVKEFETKRVANTTSSLPVEQYAGKYTDPLYGELEVTVQNKKLLININNNRQKATLDHWHYDTFRGEYDKAWNGIALAQFSLNATGKIEKINFDGIEFKRQK